MGRFSGMGQAEVFGKGSFFPAKDGRFLVLIKDVIAKDTQEHGEALIVELEILQSSDPDIPVGIKKTWFQSLTNKKVAFPNCLSFVAAVIGWDPTNSAHVQTINTAIRDCSEAQLEKACGAAKHMNGRKLWLHTRPHTTKPTPTKPAKVVTVYDWLPCAEQPQFQP